MTGALNTYKCENNIGSVSAYSFLKKNPKYKKEYICLQDILVGVGVPGRKPG